MDGAPFILPPYVGALEYASQLGNTGLRQLNLGSEQIRDCYNRPFKGTAAMHALCSPAVSNVDSIPGSTREAYIYQCTLFFIILLLVQYMWTISSSIIFSRLMSPAIICPSPNEVMEQMAADLLGEVPVLASERGHRVGVADVLQSETVREVERQRRRKGVGDVGPVVVVVLVKAKGEGDAAAISCSTADAFDLLLLLLLGV